MVCMVWYYNIYYLLNYNNLLTTTNLLPKESGNNLQKQVRLLQKQVAIIYKNKVPGYVALHCRAAFWELCYTRGLIIKNIVYIYLY